MRVGLTERHGMVLEQSRHPPPGVDYAFLEGTGRRHPIIRSPIKGFMREFEDCGVDLVEAALTPAMTSKPWIYSLARFSEAAAFNLRGVQIPRTLRVAYLERLFRRDVFRRMIFWSHAGLETIERYGGVSDRRVLDKCCVIYPAVELPESAHEVVDEPLQLLFSGDFFRKGGVHVVEAFERLQSTHPETVLWLCCDADLDFGTTDASLKAEFLHRVKTNPGIRFGRIPRERLLGDVLPTIDVYLLPTYAEAFGFALLEALSFGIPVIATNEFAIPELVHDGKTGLLVPLDPLEAASVCRGYVVGSIPADFRRRKSALVYERLRALCDSSAERARLGIAGRQDAERRFSHAARHTAIEPVYRAAV